ncbi:paraquat-inducible protein A [Vibrio salinus]|uniref:paraquat-inducible protein A n=1 Tax=Vibrio salinus TaxID=2899784 RepID=UPI001E35FCBA|nr:paraquat-inducible protein A [Vibrio salinus]MCE0492563.1 paraquat-inducible protein A [Vibrio salinus]
MDAVVKHSQIHPKTRCPTCGLTLLKTPLSKGTRANCPRCQTQLYKSSYPSLSGNLILVVCCLFLFIPAYSLNYLTIYLLGMKISASFPSMLLAMFHEGFGILAILIGFCGLLTPTAYCVTLLIIHISLSNKNIKLLSHSLIIAKHIRSWVMIDVFLISIAIACIKLSDYAQIQATPGLYSFIILQVLTVLLIIRSHPKIYFHYIETILPSRLSKLLASKKRKPNLLLSTVLLLCAAICFVPANVIPISILMSNGSRVEDTIFSGVISLITSGMAGIAAIIFIASIIVPLLKILGLGYLLFCSNFNVQRYQRQNTKMYFVLKWIGKWSMIDLFVIAITLTLVDRGQLLDFTPGYAAIPFAGVVVFTMLATETFSPRLLWQKIEKKASE